MNDEQRDRDEPGGGEPPAFGPSGYLPERASKRARKIVLRAPMGMQWVWAAIVAGAVVIVAGVLFLARADDAPGPPFERVASFAELDDDQLIDAPGDTPVLLVTAGGRPRAFDVSGFAEPPRFCPGSRRLEASDGVWSLTGRGFAGVPSLPEYPTVVFDGGVYADLTEPVPGPPPTSDVEAPICAG